VDLNLDEARAAEAEAQGETHHVIFKGERFALPPSLPIGMLEHLAAYLAMTDGGKVVEGDVEKMSGAVTEVFAAAEVFLGSEPWDRFKALGATLSDVLALLTFAMRAYRLGEQPEAGAEDGDGLGESDAAPSSDSSSSDSGEDSSPTFSGSTGSTSPEPSTAAV
jgi:hypothetical protein